MWVIFQDLLEVLTGNWAQVDRRIARRKNKRKWYGAHSCRFITIASCEPSLLLRGTPVVSQNPFTGRIVDNRSLKLAFQLRWKINSDLCYLVDPVCQRERRGLQSGPHLPRPTPPAKTCLARDSTMAQNSTTPAPATAPVAAATLPASTKKTLTPVATPPTIPATPLPPRGTPTNVTSGGGEPRAKSFHLFG